MQVEAFLERWRNKEVASVDEFKLDDSVLWKRKKPASFETGAAPPPPSQRGAPSTPPPHAPGDSDDDDMLGPPERAGHGRAPDRGGRSNFGQFRCAVSAGRGLEGAQHVGPVAADAPAPGQADAGAFMTGSGQQWSQGSKHISAGMHEPSGVAAGSGNAQVWKRSGWRQSGAG